MSLDNALIGHVLFCALLAATASLFRPKPRVSALVLIGAAGLAITIRDRAIGYLIAIAIVYAVCTAILALTRRSYLSSSTRWRGAVTMIATVAIGFSALRIGGSESLELDFAGHRVAILALDMWLVLRLVTFVWEVGSGRVASLRFIDFFAWITSPFTLIGPVLRYDESIRQRTAWLNGDTEAKSHRWFYDRRIVVGATQMARVHMVFDDGETMSLQRLRGLGLKMKGPPCFVSV